MRTFVCISVLLAGAGLGWSQGHGAGAGGGRTMAPPMPSMPASSGNHGPSASAASSQSTARTQDRTQTRTDARVQAKTQSRAEWTTRLESNTKLADRLQPLLPTGTTLDAAAAGFKNQGQFIAALHVSKNLGIPFADLKTAMTGPDGLTLGKSIQKLKPELSKTDVNAAVKTAETEAKADGRG